MVREAAQSDPTVLVLRRRYAATREQVFRAWTEPEQLKAWFRPAPDVGVLIAEVDARQGGAYRIGFEVPGKEFTHVVSGTYREFSPPQRLVFTWTWAPPADFANNETLVTIELEEVDGQTQLVLTHEQFPVDTMRDHHRQGWAGAIDNLVEYMQAVCRTLPDGQRPF